jgi:hypothetical protein
VVGVPGAGKSIMLQSWLHDRPGLRPAWLPCDARDADPAAFRIAVSATLTQTRPVVLVIDDFQFAVSSRPAGRSWSSDRTVSGLGSRVVLDDDETQVYELEPERVDAFDGAEERGLVHELSVQNSHAVLGSQYELRECGT